MVRALMVVCATQVSAVHQPSVHVEVGAHGEAQFLEIGQEIGQEEEGMWMVPATSQEHVSALEVSAGPSSSAWVQAHNAERCKYSAGNVVWNSAVAANAQRVATDNARINRMQHSNSYGSTPSAGENIYASASSVSAPAANAARAVNAWTSEVVNCPKDNSGCQQAKAGCIPSSSNAHCQVGHFTAVVWKGTREIGCGSASATSAQNGYWWTYTVCQYANSPPNFNKKTLAPSNVDITASSCSGVAPTPTPTRRRAPTPTPPRRRAPTRRRAPPRRRASTRLPANAAQWCGEQCKAKELCCNDPKVGSNQMISCAQACLMRSQGVTQAEMLSSKGGICNRRGGSGCSLVTKMGHRFSFCSRCSDLTNKCPHGVQSASECDVGASLWAFN